MLAALLWSSAFVSSHAVAQNVLSSAGIEIAVALPEGRDVSEGVRLAIDEFNASGNFPRVDFKFYDDKGDDETARNIAGQIVDSRAALVIGPAFSTNSLAAGPIYAAAGVVSLATTATADRITQNKTTYRLAFRTSRQGAMLAVYLQRVLHLSRANVVVADTDYGGAMRDGFARAASALGVDATYFVFHSPEEAHNRSPRRSRPIRVPRGRRFCFSRWIPRPP